jgi:hypothetical protein
MQTAHEMRRNSDGSPDFDLYRRRAVRERGRKRQALMKRTITIGVSAMRASVSAMQFGNHPSLVLRASAGIAAIVAVAAFHAWVTAQ